MKKKILLTSLLLLTIVATTRAQQYVNPLERWARYNVGDLNAFAEGDEDITIGKFYQFGRNVPLAGEGEVLYWANQGGPYENGSPANYRIFHIHLINDLAPNGNWFEGGTTGDTWESIVSQTVANGAPPAGTFAGYDYTVEGYVGTNGGSPAPQGWHIPTYSEMKSLIAVVGSNDFTYNTFNVNDYEETSVDLLGDGNAQNYTSDYKSIDPFTVVALRFKGTVYETAYRYEYQEVEGLFHTLEVRAKQANGATIDQIAGWSYSDWRTNDVVLRYFPATGFRRSGSAIVNSEGEGYYWTSAVSDVDKAYFITFSTTRLRGSSYNRSNAYAIRCVKDYDGASTGISQEKIEKASEVSVYQNGSNLCVSSTNLKGQQVAVYDATGATAYTGTAVGNQLSVNLPKGFYIVKVGGKSVKTVVK